MALRGKPSTAHEYVNNQCIWCHMYKVNVDSLSHVCTPAREALLDRMGTLAGLKKEEQAVANG